MGYDIDDAPDDESGDEKICGDRDEEDFSLEGAWERVEGGDVDVFFGELGEEGLEL